MDQEISLGLQPGCVADIGSTMRAVLIEQYGGPEVVHINSDVPIPTPGKGEVLVKVVCAGINFMDIHTRQGKYAESRTYSVGLPCILGMEGSGNIVQIGVDVSNLRLGQRVAWCIVWGSFAKYVCIVASYAPYL